MTSFMEQQNIIPQNQQQQPTSLTTSLIEAAAQNNVAALLKLESQANAYDIVKMERSGAGYSVGRFKKEVGEAQLNQLAVNLLTYFYKTVYAEQVPYPVALAFAEHVSQVQYQWQVMDLLGLFRFLKANHSRIDGLRFGKMDLLKLLLVCEEYNMEKADAYEQHHFETKHHIGSAERTEQTTSLKKFLQK